MMMLNDVIKEFDDLEYMGEVDEEKIQRAEAELGIKLNGEYRSFIKLFGAASVNGHELLGICDSKRLNIVTGTQMERSKNPNIPADLYLIEDVGYDKILTWQSTDGRLFQTVGQSAPEEMGVSLIEYIGA